MIRKQWQVLQAPDDWRKWTEKARKHAVRVVEQWEAGEKPTFTDSVWYDLRDAILLKLFHGKCAYCEGKLDVMRSEGGQVEHYRPKGCVMEHDSSKKLRLTQVRLPEPDHSVIAHPGYFWLAYDWRNLLPSCKDCNAGRRGKGNFFPCERGNSFLLKTVGSQSGNDGSLPSRKFPGFHYPSTAELNHAEGPLILHPYFCDPEMHFSFEDGGEIASKSSLHADKTIYHLNLDADGVTVGRHQAQLLAVKSYFTALAFHSAKPATEAAKLAKLEILDLVTSAASFSAAAQAAVSRFANEANSVLANVGP